MSSTSSRRWRCRATSRWRTARSRRTNPPPTDGWCARGPAGRCRCETPGHRSPRRPMLEWDRVPDTAATTAEPVTPALLRAWPLPLDEDGDKDARGTALVVGGSCRTPGAVLLAGLAALRAGV